EAQRELAAKQASFATEAQRLANREAALARMEAEHAARESALAAERDAMEIAEAEAAAAAELQAVLRAQADAELARAGAHASGAEQTPAVSDALPVAIVTPIARPSLKLQPTQQSAPAAASTEASLVELLRAAAEHGASMVYAVVDTRPMMRIAGEIAL